MGIVIYKNQASLLLQARAAPKGDIRRNLLQWIVLFGWRRPRALCRPFGSDVRRGKRGPLHPVIQSKYNRISKSFDSSAAGVSRIVPGIFRLLCPALRSFQCLNDW